ncbi:MAG: class I SAM-dependent methyltransferase [Gemmatimonadetes bacterium]|nr:class I SAM-dependent methyltransferase [Gemmatimonadota bacterium]
MTGRAEDPPSLYGAHADWYDRIYAWKDYAAEARELERILGEEGTRPGDRVLEVGCGTGSFLEPLARVYRVTGLDSSAEMLRVAAAKLGDVPLLRAEMQDFAVAGPFDAVVCLFSSLGYLANVEELRSTARCFARAVRPGGAVIVEPWLEPEEFEAGRVGLDVARGPDRSLARSAFARREGDVAEIEFRWIASSVDAGLELATEIHRLWLCPHATIRAEFLAAGIELRADERGLGGARPRALLRGRAV